MLCGIAPPPPITLVSIILSWLKSNDETNACAPLCDVVTCLVTAFRCQCVLELCTNYDVKFGTCYIFQIWM